MMGRTAAELKKQQEGRMQRTHRIVAEVYAEDGEPAAALRAKCNWERRTPAAIVLDYGDPREWS